MGSNAIAPTTCIVIVTFNSAQYLPELFESLRTHTDLASGRTRILVIDNASSDESRALVGVEQARTKQVTRIDLPMNSGFTGGNNRGIEEARRLGARYVMCLNPDVVVAPRWLDRLVEVMESRPDVAAAQPLILLHGTDLINTSGNQLHFCGFGYCGDYRRSVSEVNKQPVVQSVAYCSGAAMLLRMAALDEVGDFFEPLFLYHEDCELQLRMRQANWECVTVFDVSVSHKYTPTFSNQKYYWLERNRLWVLLQTWPLPVLLAAAPALLGTELAVMAFAARGGWGRDKLGIYLELAGRLPEILRTRNQRMAMRKPAARDLATMTGAMHFDGLDHWAIRTLANPVLEAYFRGLRRLVEGPKPTK